MKKIINLKLILVAFVIIITIKFNETSVDAMDHLAFQKMNIYGGQLLQDYKEEEINEKLKDVGGRQFWGWETKSMAVAAKTYFTSHTIFSYYNGGTTKIDYTYKSTITTTKKISFASTGQIKYSLSGSKSGFKHGLDSSLKLEHDYEDSVVEKEEINMSFSCDPKTRVVMYMAGEGNLYNGVAKRYTFWFKTAEGGYEYFIISTTYQVLEKLEI